MSSYRNVIILIVLIFVGCSSASVPTIAKQNHHKQTYDTLVLVAIDYELNHSYKNSLQVYLELYRLTSKNEYLHKCISLCIVTKDFKTLDRLTKMAIKKNTKFNEKYYRLAVMASLKLKNEKTALQLAQRLTKKYPKAINYEILANVYKYKDDKLQALVNFKKAYKIKKKPSILVSISTIYYENNKKQKAINILENYIKTNNCQVQICSKLTLYYQKKNDIKKLVWILKKSYKEYKNPKFKNIVLSALTDILVKKSPKKAIEYLEENNIQNSQLLMLYVNTNLYKKALKLAHKLYK
jgi:tetratricopeptide (TPR) repeat protein